MSENSNLNPIQWYPGHMTKTKRQLEKVLSTVDACLELCDARIPRASRNPELIELCKNKPRLLVFGRSDLADSAATKLWLLENPGSIALNSTSQNTRKAIIPALKKLLSERIKRDAAKGQTGRSLKVMVVGVPNVGKSTLINSLLKRKAAKAEDRPGVTRQHQWFPLELAHGGILLMDTPGMLWPKFDDQATGLHLAFAGAIRDAILDTETLAANLLKTLETRYPNVIESRYGISGDLETLARKRGYLLSGGVSDTERMANTLLDEFRAGKLGRITLEVP